MVEALTCDVFNFFRTKKFFIFGTVFLIVLLFLWPSWLPLSKSRSSELLLPHRWLAATERPLGMIKLLHFMMQSSNLLPNLRNIQILILTEHTKHLVMDTQVDMRQIGCAHQ